MYYEITTAEMDSTISMGLDTMLNKASCFSLSLVGREDEGLRSSSEASHERSCFHLTWAVEEELSLTPGALCFAVNVSIQHPFHSPMRNREMTTKSLKKKMAVETNSCPQGLVRVIIATFFSSL